MEKFKSFSTHAPFFPTIFQDTLRPSAKSSALKFARFHQDKSGPLYHEGLEKREIDPYAFVKTVGSRSSDLLDFAGYSYSLDTGFMIEALTNEFNSVYDYRLRMGLQVRSNVLFNGRDLNKLCDPEEKNKIGEMLTTIAPGFMLFRDGESQGIYLTAKGFPLFTLIPNIGRNYLPGGSMEGRLLFTEPREEVRENGLYSIEFPILYPDTQASGLFYGEGRLALGLTLSSGNFGHIARELDPLIEGIVNSYSEQDERDIRNIVNPYMRLIFR